MVALASRSRARTSTGGVSTRLSRLVVRREEGRMGEFKEEWRGVWRSLEDFGEH